MKTRQIRFLLVEDNPDHAELVRRNFRAEEFNSTLDHVVDGEQALAYLAGKGEFAGRGRPDVVLLDLNLPKIDGHEVLRSIKADPDLATIPVVILTTSESEIDRMEAYRNHVNSFLVKPIDFNQFRQMVHDLNLFWSKWNESLNEE